MASFNQVHFTFHFSRHGCLGIAEYSLPVQTTNDPRITAGIIAIGGAAFGVIAVGGGAIGVIAIGGGAVGVIAFGGGAIGLIAAGGGAVGYFALGAGGIGRYVLAYGGLGQYLFTLKRRDPEAVDLFCRFLQRLRVQAGDRPPARSKRDNPPFL